MKGLASLSTADLEHALARLESAPDAERLSPSWLETLGWDRAAAKVLSGLEPSAARAAVQIALAERAVAGPRLELVWTGPEAKVSVARDTAVVVQELLAAADRDVLIAGFRFDHGADILAPLHRAMSSRSVRADVFIDVPWGPGSGEERARGIASEFARANWPFGDPRPNLLVDRRALEGERVSLHAKCVVVDERRALVTSANFTAAGQSRNVEVGVLIHDPGFASALASQWRNAAARGLFVAAG